MKEKKLGDSSFLIRLDKGEEINESLTDFSRANKLGFASVSGIGAASRATISVFNTQEKRYIEQGFEGNLEIVSLLGNVTIADGMPRIHLHAAITGDDLNVHGGHLVSATVSVTCELVITASGEKVRRKKDGETGLMLISD
jgi:hypothetical protein